MYCVSRYGILTGWRYGVAANGCLCFTLDTELQETLFSAGGMRDMLRIELCFLVLLKKFLAYL